MSNQLHPSLFAQVLLARVLTGGTFSRAVARRVRRWVLRHGDPLVEVIVDGARLLAPLSHDLPLYRHQYAHYDTALPRLARHLSAEQGEPLVIVDVGANVGDSAAALLALPQSLVLAIEGSERYFNLLVANGVQWPGRLVPVRCFLGERTAALAATMQIHGGTGALKLEGDMIALRTLADVIAEHPTFQKARLVKVDTDGFDIAILRGATAWLATAQPVLFFEYSPHHWRSVTPNGAELFGELAALGYGPLLVYDNCGWLAWSGLVSDARRLEELDAWLTGRDGLTYADICVFPATDSASFERFRAAELWHYKDAKASPKERPAARPIERVEAVR